MDNGGLGRRGVRGGGRGEEGKRRGPSTALERVPFIHCWIYAPLSQRLSRSNRPSLHSTSTITRYGLLVRVEGRRIAGLV